MFADNLPGIQIRVTVEDKVEKIERFCLEINQNESDVGNGQQLAFVHTTVLLLLLLLLLFY